MEILLLLGVSAAIGAIMINRSRTAALAPAAAGTATVTPVATSLSSVAQTMAASLTTQPVAVAATPQAIVAQPPVAITQPVSLAPAQTGVISTATAAPVSLQVDELLQPIPTSQAIGQAGAIAGVTESALGATSGVLLAHAGGLAAAGGLFAGTAASIAASATLIGAAVVAVIMIAKLIFKGADPNQVPAAKIEQVYECASNCMGALYAAGLISQATCLSLIGALITGAAQAEDNAPQYAKDPRPFRNGITNATSVLNAAISGVKGMAPIPLKTLTASAVSALCTAAPGAVPRAGNPAGTAGPPFNTAAGHWYANSVALGLKLTKQATDYLIANKLQ